MHRGIRAPLSSCCEKLVYGSDNKFHMVWASQGGRDVMHDANIVWVVRLEGATLGKISRHAKCRKQPTSSRSTFPSFAVQPPSTAHASHKLAICVSYMYAMRMYLCIGLTYINLDSAFLVTNFPHFSAKGMEYAQTSSGGGDRSCKFQLCVHFQELPGLLPMAPRCQQTWHSEMPTPFRYLLVPHELLDWRKVV